MTGEIFSKTSYHLDGHGLTEDVAKYIENSHCFQGVVLAIQSTSAHTFYYDQDPNQYVVCLDKAQALTYRVSARRNSRR